MKILKNKTKTELKNDEIKKMMQGKVYYCPKCFTIFTRELSYKYNQNSNDYYCCECFYKSFTHDDYKKKKRKRFSSYTLYGSSDTVMIDRYISNIIMELKNQGFSNKDINKITHFSLAKINKLVLKIETIQKEEVPLGEFLVNHLGINEDITNEILNSPKPTTDAKIIFIEKAVSYGCTYDFIADILHTRRAYITDFIIRSESLRNDNLSTRINKSNRSIKLEDGIVKITNREYKK
jgi:hypothetical protein